MKQFLMIFILVVGIQGEDDTDWIQFALTQKDSSVNQTDSPLQNIESMQIDSLGDYSKMESSEKIKRKRALMRAITKGSVAVSVASTIFAYQYMSLADEAYGKYLRAGNPNKMNHYFRQSEKYDQRAGYSLLMFEISFLTAILSFLLSLSQ